MDFRLAGLSSNHSSIFVQYLHALLPVLQKHKCLDFNPLRKTRRSPWVRAFCELHHPADGAWGKAFRNAPAMDSKSRYQFKSYRIPKILELLQNRYRGNHPQHLALQKALEEYRDREDYYKKCMAKASEYYAVEAQKPADERAAVPTLGHAIPPFSGPTNDGNISNTTASTVVNRRSTTTATRNEEDRPEDHPDDTTTTAKAAAATVSPIARSPPKPKIRGSYDVLNYDSTDDDEEEHDTSMKLRRSGRLAKQEETTPQEPAKSDGMFKQEADDKKDENQTTPSLKLQKVNHIRHRSSRGTNSPSSTTNTKRAQNITPDAQRPAKRSRRAAAMSLDDDDESLDDENVRVAKKSKKQQRKKQKKTALKAAMAVMAMAMADDSSSDDSPCSDDES